MPTARYSKRRLRKGTVAWLAALVLGGLFAVIYSFVLADTPTPGVTALDPGPIEPDGEVKALFQYVVSADQDGQNLSSVTLNITPGTATFTDASNTSSIVEELSTGGESGFSLWRSQHDGFDSFSAQNVEVNTLTYSSNTVTFTPADTQPLTEGDVIYVAMKLKDAAVLHGESFSADIGNGDIVTSGTNPSFSSVSVDDMEMDARLEVLKVKALDGALDAGDRVQIIFNQAVELSGVTAGNVDDMIWVEDPSTFTKHTWGTSPTVASSASFVTGGAKDTLTITLGTSPSVASGDDIWPNVQSVNNPDAWLDHPLQVDIDGPVLTHAFLVNDAGSDGAATQMGDVLLFIFNEDMDDETIDASNVAARLSLSSGTLDTTSDPMVEWVDDNMIQVILTANQTDSVGASVDPTTSVLDENGNADNTTTAPVIEVPTVAPVDFVDFMDEDFSDFGIDGNDIDVMFEAASLGDHYDLYLLPGDMVLDTTAHFRINSSDIPLGSGEITYSGNSSSYDLTNDSQFDYTSGSPTAWYPIDPMRPYKLCVVVVDGGGDESFPQCSQPQMFTAEGGESFDMSFPFVEGTAPFNGQNVTQNLAEIGMQFSEDLDSTTVTAGNFPLEADSNGDGTFESVIAHSVTYDSESGVVIVGIDESLPADSTIRLRVLADVTDEGGNAVESFEAYFYTDDSSDSTAPTVVYSSITDGDTGVSNVSSKIGVGFDEPLSSTTVNSTNVSLSPAVAGASVEYDPFSQSIMFEFSNAVMAANTSYTLTVGTGVTDASGNALASDYTLSFTTGTADTTAPQMMWVDFTDFEAFVGFNGAMKSSTVTSSSNWILQDSAGNSVPLSGADFMFDDNWNELIITGLNLTDGEEYTLTANSSVKGLNGISVDSDFDSATAEVHMDWDMFDDASAFTMLDEGAMIFGGGDKFSADMKAFSPVMVHPQDRRESVSSAYFVSFPVTQSVPEGGKIILTFPGSFSVASAAMMTDSPVNADINGPGAGVITISDVSVDSVMKTVTLTTTGAATGSSDYLDLDLEGIVNGPASFVDWFDMTGGYTVSVSTRSETGKQLESDITSEPFEITESGARTLTVHFEDSSTNDLDGIMVYADSWQYGNLSAETDANGDAIFSGLNDGEYWIWAEDPTGNNESMYNPQRVEVNGSNVTENFTLAGLSNTISVTVNHDGSLSGEKADVWAGGFDGWSMKTITFEGDGSTSTTLKVGDGEYDVCMGPAMEDIGGKMTAQFEAPDWQPPHCEEVEDFPATVEFNLAAANRTIEVTAVDQNGNNLTGVEVWAYNPRGAGGGSHSITNTSGVATLKLTDGEWMVGAFKPGMPQAPEEVVSLDADNASRSLTIKFKKESSSIAGKVTNADGDPMQYVSVDCWSDQGFWSNAMTDASGDYTMFVRGGGSETYTCEAWSHQFGRVAAQSDVDMTDFTVADDTEVEDMDFQVSTAGMASISGTAPANSWIWVEEFNSSKEFVNWAGGGMADSDGNYTINLPKNESANRYTLFGFNPEQGGELTPISGVDVSSADATGKNFTVATVYNVNVTVTNVPDGINEVFVDVFNPSTHFGNGQPITISSGSGSGSITMPEALGYEAMIWVPGFGEFDPSGDDTASFDLDGADKALSFDLSDNVTDTITISGSVEDDGGSPVESAWVDVFNPTTGKSMGIETDSSGDYSLVVPAEGDWFINTNKSGFAQEGAAEIVEAEDGDSTVDMVLEEAGAAITGVVSDADGTVTGAWVTATNTDGVTVVSETDGEGAYSLAVPVASEDWTVTVETKRYEDEIADVAAGDTATLTVSTEKAHYDASKQPASNSIVPSTGGTLSDDDLGLELTLPANAMGNSSNAATTRADVTAAPKSTTKEVVGDAIEITATDSAGQSITSLSGDDATIKLEYDKDAIDDLMDADEFNMDADINELETMEIAYVNSGQWISMATTRKIQVKEESGDDWTPMDFEEAMVELEADADAYADYKVTLKGTTDHFTIFGAITGSDSTAPAAPSSFTGTEGSTEITLDWSDNAEGDFMEYLVFRGTSSGFTANDASQINSTQLTTSAYTDTNVTAGTTYYYKVKAADTSGNESSASSEVSVAYQVTSGSSGGSSGGGGGGTAGGGSASSSSSSSSSSDTEEASTDEEAEVDATEEETTSEDEELVEESEVDAEVQEEEADFAGHWAEGYIQEIMDAGIAKGTGGGNFAPDTNISRAEFVKMVVLASGEIVPSMVSQTSFDDVKTTDWFAPYVEVAKAEGLVNGYSDGTFRPDNEVTRGEALKVIIMGILKKDLEIDEDSFLLEYFDLDVNPFTDVLLSQWYAKFVLHAYTTKMVGGYGDGTFRPAGEITRAEMSKLIIESMKEYARMTEPSMNGI